MRRPAAREVDRRRPDAAARPARRVAVSRPRDSARAAGTAALGALLSAAILALGCANTNPLPPRPRTEAGETARGRAFAPDREERRRLDALRAARPVPTPEDGAGLTVLLSFDTAADLDLFVTGPREESVYFGHTRSRLGAHLIADHRCGDPAPAVEVVRVETPVPGRYRIGVDHHAACAQGDGVAGLYLVTLRDRRTAAAEPVIVERAGRVGLGHFDAIVLEYDWPSEDARDE